MNTTCQSDENSLDIMNRYTPKVNGHQSFTDQLTDNALTIFTLYKTAETFATVFIHVVVGAFGSPTKLLSDNGSKFCNSLFKGCQCKVIPSETLY